ncbi:MAG: peptidoglycan-binding domain-containing protein [Nannocystales bacterium]
MPTRHVVTQGECIASIAFSHGFFPETLWNVEENADLRELRGDPYILTAGDVVNVPELRSKEVDAPTGKVHRFRRKGVPETLRLTFAIEDEPRANAPYELEVDGVVLSNDRETDDDGVLEHYVPPNARTAVVRFHENEEYTFSLRCLEPLDSLRGVAGRLRSLGYYAGPLEFEEGDERFQDALVEFQIDNELEPTGTFNDGTSDALTKAYSG